MKLCIILLLATIAVAQTKTASGVVIVNGTQATAARAGGIIGGVPGPVPGGRVITGAPYSALETTEHVQTLADGTHITQPSGSVQYYRD